MTLRELWMLVVRYWVPALAIVIVCTLLGFAYAAVKDSGESYRAQAQIVTGANLSSIVGLTENAKRDMQPELDSNGVAVTVTSNSTLMTVTISVEGPNPQSCIDAANSIAEVAGESAARVFEGAEYPFGGEVSLTSNATAVASSAFLKFMAAGCAVGIFVALVLLILLDFKKRSVKTPESVQAQTELPVLDVLPAPNGEKLLANVRFAVSRLGGSENTLSVLVVPVGQSGSADEVVALLEEAANSEDLAGFVAKQAKPLSESMEAAYAAKDADAVVIVVEQWRDSLPAAISCVDELQFAEAKIAGLVFCKESKRRAA